ncbi:MAG TPA: Brp/Blh family beta-carotene 15,15'-dioxygenase, partial [Hymenobacter sp.]|nr:Brp/Blh family beta-carotene 15,15'-dioxygenase [Hymenobacter sp.]
MSILTVPNWSRRRYSYAAMLAATGLGLAFPAAAGAVLWPPLAVGMVVLGVAHGACDQLVVPASPALRATAARGWRYWLHFLLSYLGLATVVGALWWLWPAATVAGFFLLTIWHWGSADAPAVAQVPSTGWWLGHSLLRGLLVFAVPSWWWPTETSAIVNELLAFTGAAPVSAAIFERVATALIWLVAGGQLGLWGLYAGRGERQLVLAEATEILVLTAMFVTLPPRLALGVYFVF